LPSVPSTADAEPEGEDRLEVVVLDLARDGALTLGFEPFDGVE
jgi:hypothetical protein